MGRFFVSVDVSFVLVLLVFFFLLLLAEGPVLPKRRDEGSEGLRRAAVGARWWRRRFARELEAC